MSSLLPTPLPEGWLGGDGPHLGAMVVGLQPEDGLTRHLTNSEWRLLSDSLESQGGGMSVGDLYVTTLLKRRGVTQEEALPFLVDEVQRTVPRFVLALGQEVFTALTGSALELPLYRGIWQRLAEPFDWDEALVIGTFAPSDALLYPAKLVPFRRDVREFARAWLSKKPEPAFRVLNENERERELSRPRPHG